MNKALRWSAILIATFTACVIGSLPVFVTGLFVHEAVSVPLTLLTMGLLAALTSSWLSNMLSRNANRSRILQVVAATESVAILLAVIRVRLSPNAALLAVWGLVLATVACTAASRFRSSGQNRRKDLILSLVLLGLAPVMVILTVLVASLFGLTGA